MNELENNLGIKWRNQTESGIKDGRGKKGRNETEE